ncbi:MAG: UDP-N-acetylglucosamine--N-acetylmuramyl-(pentapeptide) pyrophosphoryl-undecaprenol N-acetylglucosamine transferase [Anaerolineales bacterium]|nr:UDP-N-acetylglucosamine--N-acetylmuramyl-(pentapeptide) pyrophosphoryl-undecaprenol N-acetylglucosamine transferase [Anaerolineales bacterium]MDW8446205.1 UDP-N-acetylglucosamine--N-acetylmuramyl-(pentapeptide) pyrophosphoryl-undecaprenol N-acetylglucosamine transferase [Anaerolineales bacterium]
MISSVKWLICAGGTGGGVYPALAVLQALNDEANPLREAYQMKAQTSFPPSQQIATLWVGGIGGMEAQIVRRHGLPYAEIPAAGVHGVGWKRLPLNLLQIWRGILASRALLSRFQPQVVFLTGGYLAFPMAIAARYTLPKSKRPKIVLYVPDIEPALALKMVSRFADRINVTAPESRGYFPPRSPITVSGYPIRTEHYLWATLPARKEKACQLFQLNPRDPVLLVFGGSKGARSINRALMRVLPQLLQLTQVIHISGHLDWQEVHRFQNQLEVQLPKEQFRRYRAFPYLHEEMSAAFAASDLAVCRAGASVLGELPLFGLPAILVPYPYAWRYQRVNAEYLAQKRAAQILEDNELSTKLLSEIQALLGTPSRLAEMRQALQSLAQPFGAFAIAESILHAAAESRGSE